MVSEPAAPILPVRAVRVFTHQRPTDTERAVAALIRVARESGVTLRFDPSETAKHHLTPADGLELDASGPDGVELCLVLGGDGTMLSALREYAGTGVPVFGVNFGEMGFLSTVDRDEGEAAFTRAFEGDFEVMTLPGIELDGLGGRWVAINDISIHRKPGGRVADLAYCVGNDEVGRVKCDGIVVATAAGSTGYNLANGGPVMAWGVDGYVVSFIAPHSLTARALVVAPQSVLTVHNRSRDEPVDVTVDGRPAGELAAEERLEVAFADCNARLAQRPGATFYGRLREKFGRLSAAP